ncbi:MAG: hypothetical protein HQK67_00975 [Desulfamplus sp.]|nr:hypothetical protein [Desulfamplus sp.]
MITQVVVYKLGFSSFYLCCVKNIGSLAAIIVELKFLNKNIGSFAAIIVELKFLNKNISSFVAIIAELKLFSKNMGLIYKIL